MTGLYAHSDGKLHLQPEGEPILLGPGDRIVYVPKPEHRPFIREDRLEVLYVPVDDNGQRPAWKVHHQLNGRPDIVYWVLIDQTQLDRWYNLDTP